MLLKRIEIRNVRKIKQADIDFYGPGLQVIQGANKSGKSTLAQSIALTLEGSKAFTPGMITKGQEQAEIVAFTDDGLQIKTAIKDTVKQTVSRFDESLNRYVNLTGAVREFLNSIRSGLEMPWALRGMTDAEIIEILKDRAGVSAKVQEIDSKIKVAETARTEVGRDKKKLGDAGKAPEQVKHPEPIDSVKAEREMAQDYLTLRKNLFLQASDSLRSICHFTSIARLKEFKEKVDEAIKNTTEILSVRETSQGKAYEQSDIDEMDKKLSVWFELEEKAKTWDAYTSKKGEIEQLTSQYDTLTKEIEQLRDQRKKTLADITLIKGLEIGEDNMLYHKGILRGVTDTNKVDNWSTAESVQVFFSIGAAFSGEMKVLVVDNGESLDGKTTEAISKWAESSAFLVILLKVADMPEALEEGIIYLKEGEVVTK